MSLIAAPAREGGRLLEKRGLHQGSPDIVWGEGRLNNPTMSVASLFATCKNVSEILEITKLLPIFAET